MRNLIVLLRRRLQLAGGLSPTASYLLLENNSFVLLEDNSKIELE